MGILLCFHENYCAVVTNKYWAVKKEEIVNLAIFFLFRFL